MVNNQFSSFTCKIKRKSHCRKGEYGKILVIGGSTNYPFAGIHAALAAYAAGADTVTLISHSYASTIGSLNPAIIFNTKLKKAHLQEHDVLVIGMGLPHNYAKISRIIKEFQGKVVADATAIYAISKKKIVFEVPAIITPHPGEFKNAFNSPPTKKAIQQTSQEHNLAVLLKGPEDLIVYKNNIQKVKGGTPYMAKAGTGDALAGVVGAYYSLFNHPFKASVCASQVFKKAGEKASKIHKHRLKPLHILDHI
ncbi:MAG: NAD(P)H-hydrate dehydratase [Candidatus Nanohaloarchaeota archaeon]|nr:NAD(P)H-hydrate dehydratase [Candidatus Nanohaloarchaeota archaeon]